MTKKGNYDMELGTRIEKAIDLSKKTNKEFASLLNVNPSNLSRWINSGIIPSRKHLVNIWKIAGVSLEWLLNGEGEPQDESNINTTEQGQDNFVFIKQVVGQLGAGGNLLPNNEVNTKLAFRYDWIKRKGDPHNMSITHVNGDSMEPTLLNGDLILVDHGRNYIDPAGGIYAITIGNEIFAKRIQVNPQSDKVMIISDNTKYPPMEVEPDTLIISGKVIWFGRELNH